MADEHHGQSKTGAVPVGGLAAGDVVNQYTGEKWYYTDIVKDHFFHPRNLQLEDLVPEQFDAFGMVGSPACLIPRTLIRKNPELASIAGAKIGERVLGHDGVFHPITRLFRPQSANSLVRIKNQLGDITATKDHLVFAMQILRSARSPFVHTKDKLAVPPSWVHAGDLRKGDLTLYPVPREVRPVHSVSIPRFARSVFDFKSRAIPARLPVNKETLELCGYFVAEGHTKKDNKEIGFTFGITERGYADRVCYLIKKYFGLSSSLREKRRQNRINIAVYNVRLARLFREWFGDSAREKRAPEFVLFLAPEIQRGFLKGVWRGDGYFSAFGSQPRAGFATVSETLLHQMIWLLMRQGIAPSVYREPPQTVRGVSHQRSFRIHIGDMASLERLARILGIRFRRDAAKRHAVEAWFDEHYLHLPVRRVSRARARGRLSNLEVSGSHTYATDAFLVHNCGDMMSMGLRIDPKTETITELKWKTFGCGSAIAATSMFSVMVTENGGMPIEEARKIRPQHIMERLGGLPNRKIHCSVLADKAFRKAANDYFHRTGQHHRVIVEGARVIDPKLNITDHDIEEAVLEGAVDLDSVQQKLKVGIGSPEIITEVEQLIRFYKEKYYG